MGYLNNTTRVLDAILTKKGREILSSGGDFEVSKFALGDDEIDYALWDTTHTSGTDFYGAAIDNLPALEPFNDPSEIMKYKLVTRQDGTRAMVKLQDGGQTATNLAALKYYASPGNDNANRVVVEPQTGVTTKLGGGVGGGSGVKIARVSNLDDGNLDFQALSGETYTVTLLDSSVAILAPTFEPVQVGTTGGGPINPPTPVFEDRVLTQGSGANLSPNDMKWVPFVDNVQHISQTISGCVKEQGSNLRIPGAAGGLTNLRVYPKNISANTHTSIIVMGESSGAVIEFDITITLS
tara:strand:- start:2711 stop:3595 length:885 start_codon:yes stop_codon:yes gene_type:complete